MILTLSRRALQTRAHRLADGRRVTIRHAVPADAPRLAALLPEEPRTGDVIAIDDHGAIVGWAAVGEATATAGGWSASGLAELLERALGGEG